MSIVDMVANKLLICTLRLAEEELEHNKNALGTFEILRKRSSELKAVSVSSSENNAISETCGKNTHGKHHKAKANHYLDVFSCIDEDIVSLSKVIESNIETIKSDNIKLVKVIGTLKLRLEKFEPIEVSESEFEKMRETVTRKLGELKEQE